MPISVQEQEDKPCKIYTYQQPVPKLTKCILFGYFCGSVGDENLMFGLSIIWLYTCFWGLMGRKGVCKKKKKKKQRKEKRKYKWKLRHLHWKPVRSYTYSLLSNHSTGRLLLPARHSIDLPFYLFKRADYSSEHVGITGVTRLIRYCFIVTIVNFGPFWTGGDHFFCKTSCTCLRTKILSLSIYPMTVP